MKKTLLSIFAILFAFVTLLRFQPLILPLNAAALAKVDSIVVTFEVSQFIIVDDTPAESPLLKMVAPPNTTHLHKTPGP